jgi:DNA-binding MarR family transcriptional regulator
VQRVVDLLVEDGVSQYVPNPDHKRSPLVRLTGKGETQLRKLTEAADRMHRQLARGLDPHELAIALRVLRSLRDAIRAI